MPSTMNDAHHAYLTPDTDHEDTSLKQSTPIKRKSSLAPTPRRSSVSSQVSSSSDFMAPNTSYTPSKGQSMLQSTNTIKRRKSKRKFLDTSKQSRNFGMCLRKRSSIHTLTNPTSMVGVDVMHPVIEEKLYFKLVPKQVLDEATESHELHATTTLSSTTSPSVVNEQDIELVKDKRLVYISIDSWFSFDHLRTYHGPSPISHIIQFIHMLDDLLFESDEGNSSKLNSTAVCLCTASEGDQKSNAVLMLGAYVMCRGDVRWKEAGKILRPLAGHVIPYNTEGRGSIITSDIDDTCSFDLNDQSNRVSTKAHQLGILVCLRALDIFTFSIPLIDFNSFDLDEYTRLECPLAGDMTWILEDTLVALAGPVEGIYSIGQFVEYCLDKNIGLIVRLNKTSYTHQDVQDALMKQSGSRSTEDLLEVVDIVMADGGTPSHIQIIKFIKLCEQTIEQKQKAVAVHCRAGLGRTGTMIACYLLWKFTRSEVIESQRGKNDMQLPGWREMMAFLRMMRPGSVLEDQPVFLKNIEPWIKSLTIKEIMNETNR